MDGRTDGRTDGHTHTHTHDYGGEISVKITQGDAVAQLGCMVYSFGYGVFLFGYIPSFSL